MTLYQECGVTVNLLSLGRGTASNEILDYFGLESKEKLVISSIVTLDVWRQIKKELQDKIKIDIPGTGIAFIVPLSSIGGRKQLEFLTEHQNFVKGEETVLKETKHELLVIIANAGYVALFPCVFLVLLMLSFNLFGNGLRDAFNPSLRGTED